MQVVKSSHPVTRPSANSKMFSLSMILAVALVVGIFAKDAYRAFRPALLPQGTVTISQSTLEEKYGLHVNLVAVTAAGGFVDVRLKIVDGDKAKLLLADSKNFPALFTQKGFQISAPADTITQTIDYVSGAPLFIMYPNSGNAVQRGDAVTILFGDVALKPMEAK